MTSIDLSKFVPYQLNVDEESNKILATPGITPNCSTRKLFDMKEVIYDLDFLEIQKEDLDLYFMYRDLTREEDKAIFQQNSVRFDVTIIPPKMLGREFVKTAGHFH
ncbi:MAG: glucose-6-phosphate isomerase family protein, partial [Candidatus Heimdallarchaeota archaeon]